MDVRKLGPLLSFFSNLAQFDVREDCEVSGVSPLLRTGHGGVVRGEGVGANRLKFHTQMVEQSSTSLSDANASDENGCRRD
jgi:hypothetical protein